MGRLECVNCCNAGLLQSVLILCCGILTFTNLFQGAQGLKRVEIQGPRAISVGQSVELTCQYDLEDNDKLYSVKWYKSREEFYRYVPNNIPPKMVFSLPNVNVNVEGSGPSKVVLQDINKSSSGEYSCEVATDAPNFQIGSASIHLDVHGAEGLNHVEILGPRAVPVGQSVEFFCQYDLGSNSLFAVKWYKGRQEFFRYVPNDSPSVKMFPLAGLEIDLEGSGPTKVILRDVNKSSSGEYSCEVTTDAPTFRTQIAETRLDVFEDLAEPYITVSSERSSSGQQIVRGTCVAPHSDPPADITWLINGHEVLPRTSESIVSNSSLAVAGLEYEVPDSITSSGVKLEVRCIAVVFKAYKSESKVVLGEEEATPTSSTGTISKGS